MKDKFPSSSLFSVVLLLSALLGCCIVFFFSALNPERFSLERPKVTDISTLHEADAANEGKLVFACDKQQAPLKLTDNAFGFHSYGLNLKRRVLYYQWTEVNLDAENGVRLSSTASRSAIRYERRWVPAPVAAEGFAVQGYHNETALPPLIDVEAQPTPVLNGLPLDESLLAEQWSPELADLQMFNIPAGLAARSSIVGGNTLYVRMHPGSDPKQPEVGDMMIQWLVQPMPAELSLLAKQQGGRLVPAEKPTGYQPELFALQPGERSFGEVRAELNKRGEASDRALLGGAAFFLFLLVYLLRPAMAQGWAAACGSAEQAAKPGCLVSIAAAVLLMVFSYQAGRLFIAPQDAWPYTVVPLAVVTAAILNQRRRNRESAEEAREEAARRRAEAFMAGETDSPAELPENTVEAPAAPEEEEEEEAKPKRGGCAITSGIGLLVLGGCILYWGERENAEAAFNLGYVKDHIVCADAAAAPAPENEGKPVCISGAIETSDMLCDAAFGVEVNGIKLFRHAAVKQWEETVVQYEKRRRRRHGSSTDDDTYTRYEYHYHLVWAPDYIDSDAFHERDGHRNVQPIAPELTSIQINADHVQLGAYTLSDSVLSELTETEPLPLPENYRPLPNMGIHVPLLAAGGVLELRRETPSNPAAPAALGDRRFSWSYLPNGCVYTVVAAQRGGRLVPWTRAGEAPLLLVKPGVWKAEEMLKEAEDDRFATVLGMRVCYISMLLGGFFLLLFPRSVIRRLS